MEYVLETVKNLGIPLEEVKEVIARAENLVSEQVRKQNEDLILNISREYKAPLESVRSMLESLGEVQTVEVLKALNTKNKQIVKEEVKSETKKVEERKQTTINENKPVVTRLFRQQMNKNTR